METVLPGDRLEVFEDESIVYPVYALRSPLVNNFRWISILWRQLCIILEFASVLNCMKTAIDLPSDAAEVGGMLCSVKRVSDLHDNLLHQQLLPICRLGSVEKRFL